MTLATGPTLWAYTYRSSRAEGTHAIQISEKGSDLNGSDYEINKLFILAKILDIKDCCTELIVTNTGM